MYVVRCVSIVSESEMISWGEVDFVDCTITESDSEIESEKDLDLVAYVDSVSDNEIESDNEYTFNPMVLMESAILMLSVSEMDLLLRSIATIFASAFTLVALVWDSITSKVGFWPKLLLFKRT